MASVIPTRTKLGWLKGELLASHQYKVALFATAAALGASTTGYSASNEASGGSGYTAGGQNLTPTFSNNGTKGIVDFADVSWTITGGPFAFQYALIYDADDAVIPDMAVAVLDFGAQSVTDGDITLQFPTADSTSAIIRIA